MWSVPLIAAVAVIGVLAAYVMLAPSAVCSLTTPIPPLPRTCHPAQSTGSQGGNTLRATDGGRTSLLGDVERA